MPTYEYFCADNHRSVEVMHGMSTTLRTWGEVCDKAGIAPGKTPANTPVEKLLGAGMVMANSRASAKDNCSGPAVSGGGGGCCGGMCGGH